MWAALPLIWKVVAGIVAFIGSGTVLTVAAKMITRPRLRLMYQPQNLADDSDVNIRYAALVDQAEIDGQAFFIRAFLWNYGFAAAEDCTVSVGSVWLDGERISLFARSPLKWTHKDSGPERFAPRKLLTGMANGIRVDVCKIDSVTESLQILSEASHCGTGYHWYSESGIYEIRLIAQRATPARCDLAVEYNHSPELVSLGAVGATARRHLLKLL